MAFRDRFLGALAGVTSTPSPSVSEDNEERRYGKLLFQLRHLGGDVELIALALMALREHLKGRPSSPHPEPARAATEGGRCSPLPSGGGEPSAEEIRVVAEILWGAHRELVGAAIRALDEYRARKRGGA